MLTKAEEDYLKGIFSISMDSHKAINTNIIAEKMKTKASSVTDMLKKLSKKELVIYQKYKGVLLSEKGKIIASSIVRKHRLWETFLVNKLDFLWDEVHEIAEQLEHVKSDELINRLDKYLGFPKKDPHGDPIPDKNGKMITKKSHLLSTASLDKRYRVIGIKNSSNSFLQYLDSLKININSTFFVKKKMDFDFSFQILMNNQSFILSKKVCDNLYIELIK